MYVKAKERGQRVLFFLSVQKSYSLAIRKSEINKMNPIPSWTGSYLMRGRLVRPRWIPIFSIILAILGSHPKERIMQHWAWCRTSWEPRREDSRQISRQRAGRRKIPASSGKES